MCQHSNTTPPNDLPPIPPHIPLFDAHCHPTDTLSASICVLPSSRASILAIMATRSQDQHLVHDVASQHGVEASDLSSLLDSSPTSLPWTGARLIPSFGWHPWFSHQLYDDTSPSPTYGLTVRDAQAAKEAHYAAVLSPPPQDPSFIASLPTPTPLSVFISETKARLGAHPLALVGEIGIDKAFRLPRQWEMDSSSSASPRDEELTPGGREGRLLSPYRVRMPHQQAILKAQLALAGAEQRAVSVHGVQAHGLLHETLSSTWKGYERRVPSRREKRQVAKGAEDDISDSDSEPENQKPSQASPSNGKPFPPRICLHSFSGGPEVLKQWLHPAIPAKVFFSFSTAVNLGTSRHDQAGRLADVVRLVPDDRLLVESDYHKAGEEMDAALQDMYHRVCEIKGWEAGEGAARIGRNFEEFILGKRSA